jgi:hypothetical protein
MYLDKYHPLTPLTLSHHAANTLQLKHLILQRSSTMKRSPATHNPFPLPLTLLRFLSPLQMSLSLYLSKLPRTKKHLFLPTLCTPSWGIRTLSRQAPTNRPTAQPNRQPPLSPTQPISRSFPALLPHHCLSIPLSSSSFNVLAISARSVLKVATHRIRTLLVIRGRDQNKSTLFQIKVIKKS